MRETRWWVVEFDGLVGSLSDLTEMLSLISMMHIIGHSLHQCSYVWESNATVSEQRAVIVILVRFAACSGKAVKRVSKDERG